MAAQFSTRLEKSETRWVYYATLNFPLCLIKSIPPCREIKQKLETLLRNFVNLDGQASALIVPRPRTPKFGQNWSGSERFDGTFPRFKSKFISVARFREEGRKIVRM